MIRKRNQGSAIIEMTLLMPIILGIFFLYIHTFLYFAKESKCLEMMSYCLYWDINVGESSMNKIHQGKRISVFYSESTGLFDLELHRNEDDAVRNIRRWQFATDTLRAGENE